MKKILDRTPIGKPFSWKLKTNINTNISSNTKKSYTKKNSENRLRKIRINKPFSYVKSKKPVTYVEPSSIISNIGLYKGPTLITHEMRNELISGHAETLETALMNDPFIAENWDNLRERAISVPQENISSSNPLNLKYNIEIFQGSEYPYPEYVDFLYDKSCNLLGIGEIERRTCVGVNRSLITSGTEPFYNEIIDYCSKQNIGNPIDKNPIPIEQQLQIAKFKTETVQVIRPSVSSFKEVRSSSSVNAVYINAHLTKKFKTNLTVVLTTRDEHKPNAVIISSIIILNNGDSSNYTARNGKQEIDVIANNPRIEKYKYLKSSAVSVLFTLIRDTTILSSYLPNQNEISRFNLGTIPEQIQGRSPMYQFIHSYLSYCAVYGSKPTANVVCNFNKLSLMAVSWEVAYIYNKLGFVAKEINSYGFVVMEIDISTMPHISNINRVGFLFSLLQELSLERLTNGDTELLIREIGTLVSRNREFYERGTNLLGVPGRKTVSLSSVAKGKRRKRRKTTKRKN